MTSRKRDYLELMMNGANGENAENIREFSNCDEGWMMRFARMRGMQERIDNSQRARITRMQKKRSEESVVCDDGWTTWGACRKH